MKDSSLPQPALSVSSVSKRQHWLTRCRTWYSLHINSCRNGLGPMARFSTFHTLLLIFCTSAAFAANVTGMDAKSLSEKGIASYQRGDYQDAIRLLSERAGMVPEDPDVYYYLGNCYVYTKQNDKAAHMYSAC